MESDRSSEEIPFPERLKEVIGLQSLRSFSRTAGVSEGSLRQYLAGKHEPTRPALVGLARAGGVLVEWLATGAGPKTDQDYPSAGPTAENLRELQAGYAYVPLYDIRASGGGGAIVEGERVTDVLAFKEEWIRNELRSNPADLYLIYVTGESMEPTLRPGDLILVDRRTADMASDGIYVIRMGGALLVKRVQALPGSRIRITSDNPAYQPFELERGQVQAEGLAILGRVVWAGRRM